MDSPLKKCVMFIDYEGVAAYLSHIQFSDIDSTLVNLLGRARKQFNILRAIVLGDWTRLPSRNNLERQGFICRTTYRGAEGIDRELQLGIAERIAAGEPEETYLLVSGKPSYIRVLRQLQQAGKEAALWSLTEPSFNEQVLCTSWEIIPAPKILENSTWPRQVMFQAVVLVADHLHSVINSQFLMSDLHEALRRLAPFEQTADVWINIALRERVLLLREEEYQLALPYGEINTQHPITQRALQIRSRILSLLKAMLSKHDWVAFSAAEKALRTMKLLSSSQKLRHAWLELLVAEDMLIAEQLPRPDGQFKTTTLRFNKDHPVIAAAHREEYLLLIQLIVKVSNFLKRKQYSWIAASTLLKLMANTTSYIEARAALSLAEAQHVIQLGSIPSPMHPALTVTTIALNQNHTMVKEVLARHDQLIALMSSLLSSRRLGISEALLVEEFMIEGPMDEDQALFWIWLLVSEDICHTVKFPQHASDAIRMIRLRFENRIVDQVLAEMSQKIREVMP